MAVVVVDYGAGNLKSAAKALMEAAKGTGIEVAVTADPAQVKRADRIVLPGVGAFADCRRGLEAHAGLIEALNEAVIEKQRPFLGICVGMQLMATLGIEYGEHQGLGWIQGKVVRLTPDDAESQDPADRLEQPRRLAASGVARPAERRRCVFRALLSFRRRSGLRRAVAASTTAARGRGDRPRQSDRRAVSPREEPGRRPARCSPIS